VQYSTESADYTVKVCAANHFTLTQHMNSALNS